MTDQPTPYFATPKQPRLIWNDRDKRKAAEPLPTQTVEIIQPFYSEVKADKQGQSHTQGGLDMTSDTVPDIHSFSRPDIEVRALPSGGVTVTLTRLMVDLDGCLSTQDAAKRAEIKQHITRWKTLVDYWAVDWDYNGQTLKNDWQTFRTRKSREMASQAAHTYVEGKGDKRIVVKVTDIYGNDGLKVIWVAV